MCGVAAVFAASPRRLLERSSGSLGLSNAGDPMRNILLLPKHLKVGIAFIRFSRRIRERGEDKASRSSRRRFARTGYSLPYDDYIDTRTDRLQLSGALLHLRGRVPKPQPLCESGNILLWNGEVFGGSLSVDPSENDSEKVLDMLMKASGAMPSDDPSVIGSLLVRALERIRGPWSLVYWHAATRTLWFGRDPVGRRRF